MAGVLKTSRSIRIRSSEDGILKDDLAPLSPDQVSSPAASRTAKPMSFMAKAVIMEPKNESLTNFATQIPNEDVWAKLCHRPTDSAFTNIEVTKGALASSIIVIN